MSSPQQKEIVSHTTFFNGNVPPHSLQAEQTVLGALLLFEGTVERVASFLKPEHFYRPEHSRIYQAILQLFNEGKKIDLITVMEKLKENGAFEEGTLTEDYVVSLTMAVSSAAHIDTHARLIVDKYTLRETINICEKTIRTAFEQNTAPSDVLDLLVNQAIVVMEGVVRGKDIHVEQLFDSVLDELRAIVSSNSRLRGVPSGFVHLDELTGGWQPGNLIVVAARPGMGKSAFVATIAVNAARHGVPVLFFSLEMTGMELFRRILSAVAGVPLRNLIEGRVTDEDLERVAEMKEEFARMPLFINDTPHLTISEFKSYCLMHKAKGQLGLVVVDYMQLMGSGHQRIGMTREQEISLISRMLKHTAKELEVPVVAVSQLSRRPEQRGGSDFRPRLSDLRESGAIEQDADIVVFLYRPEYYKVTIDEEGRPLPHGYTEVEIAKHRNGPVGIVHLRFNQPFARFEELPPQEESGDYAAEHVSELVLNSKINESQQPPSSLADDRLMEGEGAEGEDYPF